MIDNFVGLDQIGDFDSVVDRIIDLGPEKTSEACLAISNSLPRPKQSGSSHRFVGNSEISGFPYPCSDMACRRAAVAQAAAFSAMYADELVLFDPFSHMDQFLGEAYTAVTGIAFYISEIVSLSSLIERKIITFSNFDKIYICRDCIGKGLNSINNVSDRSEFFIDILAQYIDNSTVIYNGKVDGLYEYYVKSNFDNHSYYLSSEKPPLKARKQKVGSLLDKSMLLDMGFFYNAAGYAHNDIVHTAHIAKKLSINNILYQKSH